MSSISHQRARELIEASLNNHLVSFERTLLENHLRTCPDCRAYSLENEALDQTLNDSLQKRWPEENIRTAYLDAEITTVQYKTRRLAPWHSLKNFFQLMLTPAALAALVWILGWGILQSPQLADQPASRPAARQILDNSYEEIWMTTDLNCDGVNEVLVATWQEYQVFRGAWSVPLNTTDWEIKAISLQENGENIWRFSVDQISGAESLRPFLVSTGNCGAFLGLISGNATKRVIIQSWNGETMRTELDVFGEPVLGIAQNNTYVLTEDDTLQINSINNVSRAHCSLVVSEYGWDGEKFFIKSQVARTLVNGC